MKACLSLLCSLFVWGQLMDAVRADLILFDLNDASIESLDESASFQLLRHGLTMTITANVGELNRTGSGFGINAPGGGDDTDAIDAGSGVAEMVTFYFDQRIDRIDFERSGVGSADHALFSGTSLGDVNIVAASYSSGVLPSPVLPGHVLQLAYDGGNGFSLDSILVNRIAAVPEPSSAMLCWLGMGLAGLSQRSRRPRGRGVPHGH